MGPAGAASDGDPRVAPATPATPDPERDTAPAARSAARGSSPESFDLDAETMRRTGYAVVDLLVQRWTTLDEQPAWVGATRAEMEALLREPPPARPAAFEPLLRRLADDVLDYAGRIDHPRFAGYIPSSPTWPSVLGDALAAGYNIFQGTWLESAGPSQLELVVLDWFKEWLGYPDGAAGLLLSGASAANLTALVVARDRLAGGALPRAVLYTSDQVHSSVVRAAHVAGLAAEHVRLLPADDGFRLPLDALATAVAADRAAGLVPFLVVANAGATNTGAVDPLAALSGFCREQDLWLHVDAAYGGFAVLTGRGRERLQGIQLADSITLDPHKWLFQTYEAGCLLLRHGTLLDASFHIMPDYLRDAAVAGKEVNFADRGFQLTRMARALKIWLSLHSFGVPAFRQAVDIALDLADEAEQRIADAAQLELLAPAGFGIVCFRRHPPGQDDEDTLERLNTRILQQLNASGLAMISSTRLRGRYALRLCIMNWRTRARDVARILDAIEDAPSRE